MAVQREVRRLSDVRGAPARGTPTTAVISLLVAILSFQAGSSVAKQLIPAIGAPGTTALRLGLSAVMVCLLQRPWRALPTRAAMPAIAAYGVALGTMNFVFYMALRTIPLGIAVVLEFTGPLGVAVAASRRSVDLLWIGLAAFGVLLLLPIAPLGTSLDPAGVAFALAAGVCWALYIVFGHKAGRLHGGTASTWGMLIAASFTVPVGVAAAGRALLDWSALSMGLAVAVLSSALPYTLEMFALRRLDMRSFGILMSLEPAVAALTGLIVLHESLTTTQWVAIAAVMAASIGTVGGEVTQTDLASA